MSFGQILGYAGIIVGIGVSVWVGVAWGRGSVAKHTNEMLEKAIHQEREERVQVERRCEAQIAELRAEIAVLTERLR